MTRYAYALLISAAFTAVNCKAQVANYPAPGNNADALTVAGLPADGGPLRAWLSTQPGSIAYLAAAASPASSPDPFGTLLVDLNTLFGSPIPLLGDPTGVAELDCPVIPAFPVGSNLHLQGLVQTAGGAVLTNTTIATMYGPTPPSWSRQIGGAGVQYLFDVDVLPLGGCIAVGMLEGTTSFGTGPNQVTVSSAAGSSDGMVVRYREDGTLLWHRVLGGPGLERTTEVTPLSDGTSIVVGYFEGSLQFMTASGPVAVGAIGRTDLFLMKLDPSGTPLWVKTSGSPQDDRLLGVTALSDDSVVTVGFFEQTITLGFGEPNQTTLNSSGTEQILIARYGSDGSLMWAKTVTSSADAKLSDLTALPNDDFVVVGSVEGTATFDPAGSNPTTFNLGSRQNACVARYDSTGGLAWAKTTVGGDDGVATQIERLSDGTLVVGGQTRDGTWFGSGEPNATLIIPNGLRDAFLARLASNGDLMWVQQAGSTAHDQGGALCVASNDLIVWGFSHWDDAVVFPASSSAMVTNSGGLDYATIGVTPSGGLQWVTAASGASNEGLLDIEHLHNGTLLSTGYVAGTATFGGPGSTITSLGSLDTFVARLSPTGTF